MKRRYTKAQLNAISRYYTEKRRREWERWAAEYGILKDFYKQSKYKTVRGYVLAHERKNGISNAASRKDNQIPHHDAEYYREIFAETK